MRCRAKRLRLTRWATSAGSHRRGLNDPSGGVYRFVRWGLTRPEGAKCQRAMIDNRLVLRLGGLRRSDACELADCLGAGATVLTEESPPVGGYGDVGTRTVAVVVTAGALRAVAGYLSARQHSHDETVSLPVEIDDPDGSRRKATLTYKASPGQSTVAAAAAALRELPGVGEALERSLW
jgi:hypothetical protein